MIKNFSASINEALSLLQAYGPISESSDPPPRSALVGLVDQCRIMCTQPGIDNEPVRTIHHLACTGGTLISKCVAAMPNTQLLSEIDPLSSMTTNDTKPSFSPTDLIVQAKQSTRGIDGEALVRLFLSGLEVLRASAVESGYRLVLRDHAHSQFFTRQDATRRPTLLEIVRQRHKTVSVVTVRHPVESYISMRQNKWLHFHPATFDEYCSRYLSFLDRHEGIPVFRYEDFTSDHKSAMQEICTQLQIPYQDQFEDLFSVFKLTGDSGRKSDQIMETERRKPDAELQTEINASTHYEKLVHVLHYMS